MKLEEPLNIVIIEDEEPHFQLMKRAILKTFPHSHVHYFEEATVCFDKIGEIHPDIIMVDYLMPRMNGIEFLEALQAGGMNIPVIMITGQGDEGIAVKAMKLGASDYLVKSTDFFAQVPRLIERVMRERHLKNTLDETEKRFRDLAEGTSDWIWEVDMEGRYVYSNPMVERITGYTTEEILQKHFYDLFPTKEKESQRRVTFQVMQEGKPLTGFVNRILHKQQREVILETNGVPIVDKLGKLRGYRGIDRDITRRKRTEEALRESEERFRSIYEESPIGIGLYSASGTLIDVNEASLKIFGISDAARLQKVNLFKDPNLPAGMGEKLRQGQSVRYEIPINFRKIREQNFFETRKTETIYADILITPLYDGGQIQEYLAQIQDITHRRRAEEALKISHRFLEISNRNLDMPVLLQEYVTELKRFTQCAAAGIRILHDDGSIPYQAWDGFHPDFLEQENLLSTACHECRCTNIAGGKKDFHWSCSTSGGSLHITSSSRFLASLTAEERRNIRNKCNEFGFETLLLIPIRWENSILGLIHLADPRENAVPPEMVEVLEGVAMGLGTSIKRVQAREELSRAHDELELRVQRRTRELALANKMLTEEIEERKKVEEALRQSSEKLKLFAYSVMHDLKSPAIGIHGLTKLLQKQYACQLDERGKRYCDQITRASELSAALVEKINNYIASKEAPLEMERLHSSDLFQFIRNEFAERMQERHIRWTEPEYDVEILADRLSLLRVIRNLVDNALKYGGDRLSRIRIGHEASPDFHTFSVEDDGIGIKKEDCEKIFGLFKRHTSSSGVAGTGLGLSIVREIAERHGGKVWAEPGQGGGTVFYIALPREVQEERSLSQAG